MDVLPALPGSDSILLGPGSGACCATGCIPHPRTSAGPCLWPLPHSRCPLFLPLVPLSSVSEEPSFYQGPRPRIDSELAMGACAAVCLVILSASFLQKLLVAFSSHNGTPRTWY
eukprot:scaffold176372_cov25-Tisochrysis_lutea.AAC.3